MSEMLIRKKSKPAAPELLEAESDVARLRFFRRERIDPADSSPTRWEM